MMALQTNALYYGDCLEWMARWDDRSVDLIYLDPPFNSQADYNILFGSPEGGVQGRSTGRFRTFGRGMRPPRNDLASSATRLGDQHIQQ